jgi:Flp pilus assembly protein TadG
MAIALVVLLPIMMGILEFGWLLKNVNQINNAAREGARAAAVGRTTTDITTRAVNMAKPLKYRNSGGSKVDPVVTMTVSTAANNGASYPTTLGNTTTTPAKNNALGSDLIKVRVQAHNQSLTGFFPYLQNKPIEGIAVMRREF